jgi:uncharacterized damage-inducible protein DinB
MTIPELFLLEFDEEIPSTRKLLERVPEPSFSWKPHERSMTLGRLASHVAELPARCVSIVTTETYVRQPGTPPWIASSTAELVSRLDANAADARSALAGLRDDQLATTWSVQMGDRTLISVPRVMALRRVFMDHLIHHRAQLGVFLRLLDIPIPGMFGSSADDPRT